MKLSSLLALDADHRAIGDFHVGLPIQRHPNRKAARCVVSNDLNATNGLTARPLSNGVQAFFAERRVAQSDCYEMGHERHFDRSPVTSGLPLRTDVGGTGRHVSKVPKTEVLPHAITRCRTTPILSLRERMGGSDV